MRTAAIIALSLALWLPACAKKAKHDTKNTVPPTRAPGVKTTGGQVRQVVRQAAVDLQVKKIDPVRRQVEDLARTQGGYVHSASYTGGKTARSWEASLRVPQRALTKTLAGLRRLGIVRRERIHTEEVTQAVLDVRARLKNSRVQETRYQQLAAQRTGSIADLLKVEKELRRIRQEIERLEARDRHFQRATSMARVDLTLERRRTAAAVPAATRITRAFRAGFVHVRDLGVALLVFFGHSWLLLLILAVITLLTIRLVIWLRPRFRRLTGLPSRISAPPPHIGVDDS